MESKTAKRIVIIGAVAAGTKSAAKARRMDPHAEISLYTEEAYISYAGCGQPYYIGGEILTKEELLARTPDQFKSAFNIDIFTCHRVTKIDPHGKTIEVTDLHANQRKTIPFDALVLATGASPIVPRLPGVDLPGVFTVRTIPDAESLREKIDTGNVKEAVVVGGGYIGLEMVENLVNQKIRVTLIEREDQLAPLFDSEVAAHIRNTLLQKGVHILTGTSLEEIHGSQETGVQSVKAGNETIDADLVILSIGIRPNVRIAQDCGIELGPTGAIKVDSHLQTNIPGIYAGGDCAETTQLVTGKPAWVPLGSTANKQGRVIGINITGGNTTFPGVLGTGIFRVFDLNIAKTGLNEKEAKREGIDYIAVIVPVDDKPHYMPGGLKVIIKLLAERSTRRLIGAEVWGRGKVDKVIDTLAVAIQMKATVDDAQQFDLAYAPPFAPAMGNVITAVNVLQNKLDGLTESILPLEVIRKKQNGDNFLMLDVRPPENVAQVCLEECVNLPMAEWPGALADIPKDKEIITSCMVGLSAAHACRVLKQNGFTNTKYMDGGITAWPDPIPRPMKK